ncbi:hypothetical protein [Rubrivirga sp. IMCC43871]|uniref:hypothetical protein n=1 Tax=Rubrivirga sp. IMCC43871 TaxID=3391575 RepID=UPI00398FE5A0
MFHVPIPRRSFLDSPLRSRSHENRQLSHHGAVGDSHLGHGHRLAPTRPAVPGTTATQSSHRQQAHA